MDAIYNADSESIFAYHRLEAEVKVNVIDYAFLHEKSSAESLRTDSMLNEFERHGREEGNDAVDIDTNSNLGRNEKKKDENSSSDEGKAVR